MSKIFITEHQLEILTGHLILTEQNQIGDIVVIDGKKYKVTDLIEKNLPKTNIGQQFASGTYQLSDESKTKTEALLQKMIKFFKMAELQNTSFNVTLDGGASQVPLGDNLANELGINLSLDKFVGRNKELAKKRAAAIRKLLVDGLKSQGVENVTIPEPTVIVGKTKWDRNKGAKHSDYSKEQFMNVSVQASGTKVVKQQLPDFCKKPFVPKKGGQATKEGFRDITNKLKNQGVTITIGRETLTDIKDTILPDMFEILYNGEVYRSKNPDTQEQGFVSGEFSKLSEEQVGELKVRRDKQKEQIAKIEADVEKYGYDRPITMKGRIFLKNIKYWFDLSDRKVLNPDWEKDKTQMETYRLDYNGQADLQWFQDFYKKFPK